MKHQIRLIIAVCLLLATPFTALASKTHVVTRSSETLKSIARQYNVTVTELKSLNNISSSRLSKGQSIIIPTTAAANTPKPENCGTHKVAKGESLPSIARKTGVSMATLRKLNSLKGNRIKQGQLLALSDKESCELLAEKPKNPSSEGLKLVNRDLLNDKEMHDTLAELSEIDTDKPVDLAKNLDKTKSYAELQKSAYSFLGARYRFGGNSSTALDCSSFTQQVFRLQDVKLPRTAREQFHIGNEVNRGDLQRGDLVFFRTYARFPSHVGIYLGNRKMIHASSRDRRVVISSMDTPYYISRYLGARRIPKINPDTIDIGNLILGVEEENDSDTLKNDHLGLGAPEVRAN